MPAPGAGTIVSVLSLDDTVSEGDLVAVMEMASVGEADDEPGERRGFDV